MREIPPGLLHLRAIADQHGVAYETIRGYYRDAKRGRGPFPLPAAYAGRTPLWTPEQIREWTTTRPGKVGRPRKPRAA